MKNINPLFLKDFYKADHRRQYPEGTTLVYSNFTPRSNKYAPGDAKNVVVFGIQYLIKEYLIDQWNMGFFNRDKEEVVSEYKALMDRCLGPDSIPVDHIEALHDLGYLPIKIKALDEGSLCPIGVPMLTIVNTHPDFFWITNFLETLLSSVLWKPMTSATTAFQYRKEFERHAELTGSPKDFIGWQGHDFSFRGMSGIEDACISGMGHLASFNGTDTIPAIVAANNYYPNHKEDLIGGSVPATEHSVMCMGGDGVDEFETFKRLITEVYPSGIVSIVSDTWDLWKVMTDYLPRLKDEIEARDGRVVIRPDSGDPVEIICGTHWFQNEKMNNERTPEQKGCYQLLWDTFGGETNNKGYKVLNPKVGLIYGDSITLERQKNILSRLESKNFTASNLVLGIGSYTYEYVTRDCFGFAMKATYGEVKGVGQEIFKDPITDDGLKKSAKGLLCVGHEYNRPDKLVLFDQQTRKQENTGYLNTVFEDGQLYENYSLTDIKEKINENFK
jgi:nicotinamide phosphoribosyltransferase